MSLVALLWILVWVLALVGVVYLLCWAVDLLAGAVGMPAKMPQILKAIIVVVAVIVVVTWLIGALPAPPHLSLG